MQPTVATVVCTLCIDIRGEESLLLTRFIITSRAALDTMVNVTEVVVLSTLDHEEY